MFIFVSVVGDSVSFEILSVVKNKFVNENENKKSQK